MLIYNPAFDTHHCIFRLLRLLTALPDASYELERIRILDFYLLFPATLNRVRFPRAALRHKRAAIGDFNRYERIEDPRRILNRLEPYQLSALRYLAARELIDVAIFAEGRVRRSSVPIPSELTGMIAEANRVERELVALLTGPFRDVELYGASGLKARTQLFEYRYDPAATVSTT